MKFGPVAVEHARGAVLAHAVTVGDRHFRKARVLSATDIDDLRAAGIASVVAAILAPDDLGEDRAAAAIAQAMRSRSIEAKPAATGRVNLHAQAAGVFTADKAMIDAINTVDPAITIATLAQHAVVEKGQMVATVKIIPFAVAESVVQSATTIAARGEIFAVNAFKTRRVGMIQTILPGLKDSVLAKTVRVTQARLDRSGSTISAERRIAHDPVAVAEAIAALAAETDMVLVFGASAMCDFDDVIPAAIRRAGGSVIHAGMPVDPGNLIVLGRLAGKPVIGAPGCARSPKENGFDWVLDRLMAGLDVTAADISGMGVGGLLMEIPTRPQPREPARAAASLSVPAIVLAAGSSTRMGGPNKLMATFSGKPLIRQTVERVLAAQAGGAVVVTGHQAARVREALDGLDVGFAHNADFAAGLSGSLKAGIAALPADAAGAMIVLGDMPGVSTADLDRLVATFRQAGGSVVVRACHDGKRGNPVLLPHALFAAVAKLEGDTGARHLIEAESVPVVDLEIGQGAAIDVDTPDALAGAGGVLQG